MSKENSTPLEKLFGSKTRAKLLQLFFANPTKSFYIREMTRVIDGRIIRGQIFEDHSETFITNGQPLIDLQMSWNDPV